MMEWACKAITMTQFVQLEGAEFDGAHCKLRKARREGGLVGLWERVAFVAGGGWDFKLGEEHK